MRKRLMVYSLAGIIVVGVLSWLLYKHAYRSAGMGAAEFMTTGFSILLSKAFGVQSRSPTSGGVDANIDRLRAETLAIYASVKMRPNVISESSAITLEQDDLKADSWGNPFCVVSRPDMSIVIGGASEKLECQSLGASLMRAERYAAVTVAVPSKYILAYRLRDEPLQPK